MYVKVAVVFFLCSLQLFSQQHSHSEELLLMGSRFEITAVSGSQTLSQEAVTASIEEIHRIEHLISEYDPTSQVSEINRKAGIAPVMVDYELYSLIERCIKVSVLTDGAFDISWAGASKIWRFDEEMTALPSSEEIKNMTGIVGYSNIILNRQDTSVFLKLPGMKIGFGAIGKGYAANKATAVMKSMHISGGIVIAGGDLVTFGKPLNGEHWTIGIANPENPREALAWLKVDETAVVTSGNYEKFVMIDGVRYTHIINPKTCLPASGMKSVTIFCPDAELADALSTAIFVMGTEEGLKLINQLKAIECLIIDDANTMHTSDGLKLQFYKQNTDTNSSKQSHIFTIGQ